jgi:hypothetical protein
MAGQAGLGEWEEEKRLGSVGSEGEIKWEWGCSTANGVSSLNISNQN